MQHHCQGKPVSDPSWQLTCDLADTSLCNINAAMSKHITLPLLRPASLVLEITHLQKSMRKASLGNLWQGIAIAVSGVSHCKIPGLI